ncbi:hypothetical protein [Flavobacterium soyae]|uniref:Deaminase of polymorphic toxin system n=1 Tax=Flavobacterium soyae TaxID=2903098 RepID=A0ABZ2UK38_9FLAO
MAYVGYFKGQSVYNTDLMSDIRYDDRGHIVEFKLLETYIYVSSQDYRSEEAGTIYAVAGFFKKEKFLEYLAKKIDRFEIKKFQLNFKTLKKAINGDIFKTTKLNTENPYDDFCKVISYEWKFENGYKLLDVNSNLIIPSPTFENFVKNEKIMEVNPVAKDFFLHKTGIFINDIIDETEKREKTYQLVKIALCIHWINKDIFSIFENNSTLVDYIESQNTEWSSLPIFNNPTIEDFQEYYKSVVTFYKSVYSNQLFIQNTKEQNKLYWLAQILSPQGLIPIPVKDKISLLRYIAEGTIKGETSNIFGEVNEEQFVLDIISSITNVNHQIDYFFSSLKSVNYNGNSQDQSLYEILYSKIHDRGLGAENLKKLMNLLYQKWLLSSIYPYNLDGSVKDNLINKNIYNKKPINIDYKATEVLWMFNNTNYDFNFNGKNINITKDGYEINPATGNAIPKEYVVGSYDLFQAITIKNTDDNTENTKFITTNIGGEQKAILPIFYLKYIDDKKSTENLVTAIELTFDLALTATGIGNLAKLRHLKHLTSLGRVALGLEAAVPGQALITYELAQGVAGLIEVSSSVASILLSYGNTYRDTYCNQESQSYDPEKCKFYTRLDVIVNVMQIFSGVLDYATSRQLKNASRKILDGPIPDGFDPDALIILRKFAGDIDEIKEVFRAKLFEIYGNNNSNIWQKLNSLPTSPINKQELFILDFEKATQNTLLSLNTNGGLLIDRWSELASRDIIFERKSLDFLNNTDLIGSIIRYYDQPILKNILSKLDPIARENFLKEFGKIIQISPTSFNKLIQNPNKLELILDFQKKLKLNKYDEFSKTDILEIVNSNLNNAQIDLLRIKSTTTIGKYSLSYLLDIKNINISLQRLKDIQNGDAFPFFSSLNKYKRTKFKSSNKLLVDIQFFNGTNPSSERIIEHYLSGDANEISKIFPNNNYLGNFIEPTNYSKFEIFNKKAIQSTGRDRRSDTEVKFIFNLLENHWNKGNRFVINIESTLYACPSCQSYFIYLKELAKKDGKILEISFYSKTNLKTMKKVKNKIK